ncbi:MAG: zinc ribbon domain-containing protein, partial [Ardenticatenaceae bacterium]
KMMGVTRRQTWRRKDGRRSRGVYRYYQCQARNNQSVCEYHTWRAVVLEGIVLSQLRLALQARGISANGHSGSERRQEIQAIWESRIRNAERRFVQAMKKAADGGMALDTLGEYINHLDAVRRSASRAEAPADVFRTLDSFDSLAMDEKQSFLERHIARVVVKDDTVDVQV